VILVLRFLEKRDDCVRDRREEDFDRYFENIVESITDLAFMVISGYFNLGIVIIIFMFLAVGSAFFYAGAGGIVPQLVPSGKLQEAMQQSQAVSSGGSILGGILGGILVSALGTGGAFAADALSYFIAAIATYKIKADTMPRRHSEHKHEHTFTAWLAELKEGFYVVWKIPVEFWMTIVFALLNFIVGPIIVGLPVLVKQSRGLPPWFYGGLYSSISIGIIAGSLIVGRVCKIVWQDIVIMAGIIVMGIGFSLLPWMPGMLLPLLVMMFFGVGNAFTNIPATAQPLIAMPDRFRARTSSVSTFLCMVINPLGIAVSGIIIARYGVEATISICGILIILFAPLLYLIPNFSRFYRLEPKQAETFFTENYPEAFKARWPVDLSSETKTASQTNLKNR